MSETNHTPAPWTAHEDGLITTGDEAAVSIAQVLGPEDVDVSPEQFHADARLIAAAPTLLAASQKAMAFFNQVVSKHPEIYGDVQDVWHDLSHAVVKATSEAYALYNKTDGHKRNE